ncbi:uncharacterized protein LOC125227340 [Leguminivora glycinivorella]|uniref:uncharacterized protein LOC125227340 n=1 Tax=Leguminivora glycinivorella TaxID=1035111 RepID=UPI00200CB949|nr:uncharacterized protein LOC125227340 [Leguminivora glycinivorella]
MSPLARSLLALAALIATADAQYRQCTTKVTKSKGLITDNPVPLVPAHVPFPGGLIRVPDYGACGYSKPPVGEKVICCNSTTSGKYPPPDVEFFAGSLDFVVNNTDPMGSDCSITQYCL